MHKKDLTPLRLLAVITLCCCNIHNVTEMLYYLETANKHRSSQCVSRHDRKQQLGHVLQILFATAKYTQRQIAMHQIYKH